MRWRVVSREERQQRGCQFCIKSHNGWSCPFEVCPYAELDGFNKYQDFLRSVGATVPQIIKRLKEGIK